MHFEIPGHRGLEMVFYLEIKPGMPFTCFPLFATTPRLREGVRIGAGVGQGG